MRSIVMKSSTLDECGICKERNQWVEEMEIDGIHFLYCHKCNTITFCKELDLISQNKIENSMNKYYQSLKEKTK